MRVAFDAATSATAKKELAAIDATGDEVLGLPAFTGKPVVVLSASKPLQEKSALADDANERRRDIVRLFPGAAQVWVDSGHGIPRSQYDDRHGLAVAAPRPGRIAALYRR